MKIIISPDSFKGSCSALSIAKSIQEAIYSLDSSVDFVTIPVADGGEGTIDAITSCVDADIYEMEVKDPLGRPVMAKYAILKESQTAVIEMAQASGLPLISEYERNPMIATTYGTGELMKAALDRGCKKMIIGIGGSATNDGGAGALMALGASFCDANGEELPLGGGALADLCSIDLEKFDKRLFDIEITVACDVTDRSFPCIWTSEGGYAGDGGVFGPCTGTFCRFECKGIRGRFFKSSGCRGSRWNRFRIVGLL